MVPINSVPIPRNRTVLAPASPGQADAAQDEDEEKEEEEEEEEEEGQANVQYIIPASIVLSIINFLFELPSKLCFS